VNKHVFAAVVRRDEAVAFCGIEPFYCAIWHVSFPYLVLPAGVRQPG
jgi:hypothetical protein